MAGQQNVALPFLASQASEPTAQFQVPDDRVRPVSPLGFLLAVPLISGTNRKMLLGPWSRALCWSVVNGRWTTVSRGGERKWPYVFTAEEGGD